MPTYALLGATGSTGSAILRGLLNHPIEHLTLNVFVRSKAKLLRLFPILKSSTTFKTNIIEGTPGDTALLQDCLRDASIVFMCIAQNTAPPGDSLVYDTTSAIIAALRAIRSDNVFIYRPPTILQNRTVSLNPIFIAQVPWLAHELLFTFLRYPYEDLERACDTYVSLASSDPGLLHYVFVDPPALHDAEGTTPTGHKLVLDDMPSQALSYADLGLAFIEIATRKDEFAGKGVGVSATGPVKQTWQTLLAYMGTNLWYRIKAMR